MFAFVVAFAEPVTTESLSFLNRGV